MKWVLPRELEDLQGMRAARWFRESTAGQWDDFGPDAQREQQDRAIERWAGGSVGEKSGGDPPGQSARNRQPSTRIRSVNLMHGIPRRSQTNGILG